MIGMSHEEIWNLGLEPRHADGRVRSGIQGVGVTFLPRGARVYRFQSAGAGMGGWWSTPEVLQFLLAQQAAGDYSLGTLARIGSAVLHSWNEMNELLEGEVVKSCMVFTGVGRPQSELIPKTNFKITYSSCKNVPQLYVPFHDLTGGTGRRAELIVIRGRKKIQSDTLHSHHSQPVSHDELKKDASSTHHKFNKAIDRLKNQRP
jgi:hypothetical protein